MQNRRWLSVVGRQLFFVAMGDGQQLARDISWRQNKRASARIGRGMLWSAKSAIEERERCGEDEPSPVRCSGRIPGFRKRLRCARNERRTRERAELVGEAANSRA